MKSTILMSVAALALLGFAGDAAAMKYKCACETGDPGRVTNGKTQCVETYTGHDQSVSVQEKDVKVYVDSDNVVQGDKTMDIRFRPRNKKCLVQVYDNLGGSGPILDEEWCKGGSYVHLGPFKLAKWGSGQWRSSWEVITEGKSYSGYAIFGESEDKKYMQALCLQNR